MSFLVLVLLAACGGGGSGNASGNGGGAGGGGGGGATTRSFFMGTSLFFGTPRTYPDFLLENTADKDLISLHVDDFWGVPWEQCAGAGCVNLPANWVAQWQQLAATAQGTGKVLYLAVSPLSNRRTLAGSVQADGTVNASWLAPAVVDANGCYLFTADAAAAAGYAQAYVNYVKYLVNLVKPSYLSVAIEMNIPFSTCASQKNAWIAWYTGVHEAIKAAFPTLVVFPTFQLEFMYGSAAPAAACATGTSYDDCFRERLTEALSIPGDRIAFSSYPESWVSSSAFGYGQPPDTFSITRQATTRGIWVSETGWNTVPILNSYAHADGASCSTTYLLPALYTAPTGPIDLADEAAQSAYMSWLLAQAQSQKLEAVIWWLNRDYLDQAASATCPCTPASSDTCSLAATFYAAGGVQTEALLRIFGNMGLRRYDGTPHAAYAVWQQYLADVRTP